MKEKINIKFKTFFMGGFECADHINRQGKRVNLLKETQHDLRVEEDYRLLLDLNIKVIREGICWSAVERVPYIFDFSEVRNRLRIAEKLGIQVIWDLCHFGYPDGIFPTHPLFTDRFMALCRAFALFHRQNTRAQLMVVPINEISFLSWHSGEVRGTVPFAINSGFDIKYHLCKAAIEGIHVLRQTVEECEIFLVEPLVKIHRGTSEITEQELNELNLHQFQAIDIISGRLCPELGGSIALFDKIGVNYYHSNQWDHDEMTLHWPERERKLTPLSELLLSTYSRYNKPIIISETGHFGVGRKQWLEEISLECVKALEAGVDLEGICIYPVIDRPDWDNLQNFHNSGIFDLDEEKNRIPHSASVEAIRNCTPLFPHNNSMVNSLNIHFLSNQ